MSNKIQNIFRLYFEDNPLPKNIEKAKVVKAILKCGTEDMGHPILCHCQDCGYEYSIYRSCGNRNCPHCQSLKQAAWAEARCNEVLEVPYYHGVFTIPHELNSFFYSNQKECYSLLLNSVSVAINAVAQKHLKSNLGCICVLHTWSTKMLYHPHVHVIIPGVNIKYRKELIVHNKFLLPVVGLMKKFRYEVLKGVKNLGININLNPLYKKSWNVFIKDVANDPEHVINYLSRYTHRIAVSDSRIISYDKYKVTFSYKDYSDDNKIKQMTISTKEFIRRYLLHVLPRGFCKIRFYGLLANRCKKANIALIRRCLNSKKKFTIKKPIYESKYNVCPCCYSSDIIRTYVPPKLEVA